MSSVQDPIQETTFHLIFVYISCKSHVHINCVHHVHINMYILSMRVYILKALLWGVSNLYKHRESSNCNPHSAPAMADSWPVCVTHSPHPMTSRFPRPAGLSSAPTPLCHRLGRDRATVWSVHFIVKLLSPPPRALLFKKKFLILCRNSWRGGVAQLWLLFKKLSS